MNKQTAILIFANSGKKTLHSKRISDYEFFNIIDTKTLEVVKKTGLPFFHFSEDQQIGFSFGERFSNAIASVFEKGYQNIITIGNDIPNLNTKILNKAEKHLENKSHVLGPSTDGGFYLMGFQQRDFNKEEFASLPWETKRLKQSFIDVLASKNLNFSFLETLTDIDASADIDAVLKSSRFLNKFLKSLLSKLTAFSKHFITPNRTVYKIHCISYLFNKGSPFLLHI
ncbi:hypothetical protein BWZ20_06645 [Winogradskyella sp. J14-2]|uniref:TIGR04282 family arsenosugar biosynthesis glycosyltransferase n=1 Tax=Winogradskyella sp. J14-2 TaxID=1936080 RepID=UPI000972BE90|nr:DUF2064 domain-containing protein [Winogradskyella sp. J14-2]APY07999.1 hypothetical protein BWZ20_06645 [Winogradskyella sp. J14-2]